MQADDTTTLFKKNILRAVLFLIMTITLMILSAMVTVVTRVLGGLTPFFTTSNGTALASNFSASIVFSVILIVFAGVGKANASKNRILAFIFGILTIVFVGLLLSDRGYRLVTYIQYLVDDADAANADPLMYIYVGLRAGMVAASAIIVAYGIVMIVAAANIIKQNVPTKGASSTTTTAPAPQSALAPAPATAPKAKQVAAQTATPEFCDGCGAPLKEGAKFCESCGKSV